MAVNYRNLGNSIHQTLAGYVGAPGTVNEEDSILVAIEKLAGNGELIGSKYVRSTRFELISAGTAGTVEIPANATIILDDFGGTVDAVISGVDSGKPDWSHVLDENNRVVACAFDSDGNYVLSGTPQIYPIAIVFRVKMRLDFLDVDAAGIVDFTNTQGPKGESGYPPTPIEKIINAGATVTLDVFDSLVYRRGDYTVTVGNESESVLKSYMMTVNRGAVEVDYCLFNIRGDANIESSVDASGAFKIKNNNAFALTAKFIRTLI